MSLFANLLRGIVVESRTPSFLGSYFYSDKIYYDEVYTLQHGDVAIQLQPLLNEASTITIIGIAAGLTRMALAIIHNIGHFFAFIVTWNKGHLIHIAKGSCEFLRGLIEAIPFIGRSFANSYYQNGTWWMIKIYNPDSPDSLDRAQKNWVEFATRIRPTGYFRENPACAG